MDAPAPASESHPATNHSPPARGAYFALAILFGMNLLNYMDRYVFFSVGELIQRRLRFDDRQYAVLSTSFMLVYTLVSPLVGWLGDRYNRRRLLAFGVGLWSLATVGTAFAHGFRQMFLWRALLGVGEASYGVIAPAILADLFGPRTRNRALGLYTLALPIGGALGYILGGEIGGRYGWRAAFWVVGLPGLVLALAGLVIPDPGRARAAARPGWGEYGALVRNPTFLLNTAGLAAVTFATGAYAAWGATFYQRVHGLSAARAGRWIGGMTAAAGLIGIALGTWTSDRLLRLTRRAYLLQACAAVLLALPFAATAILDPFWRSSLPMLFVAMVLMATVLGPCTTVTANVVPPHLRSAGFALSIFLVHLFGDISSPLLIGELSEWFGRPEVAAAPLGRFLAGLGAAPVPTATGQANLTVGLLAVVPVMALGGLFFLLGSRHLAAGQDRARRSGRIDAVPARS